MTPYEAVLGARFHHLSPQVRQLHGARALSWTGRATVVRGGNPIAGLVARQMRFPSAMDDAPFQLTLTRHEDGSQTWRRDFNGHITESVLYLSEGSILEETFGRTSVRMTAETRADQLFMKAIGATVFGRFKVPEALVPRSRAHVWQDEAGRYRFDIKSELPVLGTLVRYFGWLRPDASKGFATER